MPPHLVRRGPKNILYIRDGRREISTKTNVKRLAKLKLEQYTDGRMNVSVRLTIRDYYDLWITAQERNRDLRPSTVADYRTHFRVILPELGDLRLMDLDYGRLTAFRDKVAATRKSKTVRNIVGASFRAMWRDAMREEKVSHNPFALLSWPTIVRPPPDPFTPAERDRIIAHFLANDPLYYPWIFILFHTGMRPSEAAALTWADIDTTRRLVTITKSRDMGGENAPKTKASRRIIPISEAVACVFGIIPRIHRQLSFINKRGRPLTKKWAQYYWPRTIKALGLRHRKFYATRHTFITEAIKAGENVVAVAQYVGTSAEMIQQDYCGRLDLPSLASTKIPHGLKNPFGNMVAGPGFEPLSDSPSNIQLPGISKGVTNNDG